MPKTAARWPALLAGTALTLAAPLAADAGVLTTFTLSTANGDSVQSMSLSTSTLNSGVLSNPSANLATGLNPYYYILTSFTPSVAGSYMFGQGSASCDTVMIVYVGSFNASSPATNALVGNDDTSPTSRPAGVSQTTTCGSVNFCPQVTANLTSGTTYYIVISTYSSGNSALTLADGQVVEFYVYGDAAVAAPEGHGSTPPSPAATWASRGSTTGGTAAGVGTALDAGASSTLQTLVTQLSALSTPEQSHALRQLGGTQLTPQINIGGSITAPTVAAIQTRQVVLLSGDEGAPVGAAAGSQVSRGAFWGQFLGGYARRDTGSGSSGYSASSYGMLFGADAHLSPDVVAGLALSWLRSTAHGKSDATGDRTQVDSYQATAYGTWRPDAGPLYVEGLAGLGINAYDQRRSIDFTGTNALSNYNGLQYQAKLGVGYDIPVAAGLTATPVASLRFVRVENEDYKESGAGTANLSVDKQNFNSVESELGGKLAYAFATPWGRTTGDARAVWLHDYTHGPIATSAAIGGSSFVTTTDRPAENGARLTLGLSLEPADGVSVRLEYEGELRSDYQSHTGLLTLRSEF